VRTEVVTTLKRQATELLAELHESKEPIFISEHGQPSAYLLDVANYEWMLARMKILEGIIKGEQAIRDGRTMNTDEATQALDELAQQAQELGVY
jgi:prevent-host-death family protein